MWEKEKVTLKETIQSQQREISDLLRTIRYLLLLLYYYYRVNINIIAEKRK